MFLRYAVLQAASQKQEVRGDVAWCHLANIKAFKIIILIADLSS